MQAPCLGEDEDRGLQAADRVFGVRRGERGSDLDAELAGQPHGGEGDELTEPVRDLHGALVVLRQRPGPRSVTNRHHEGPMSSKVDGAGPRMAQIPDELRQNPCLVRVCNGPVTLLDERLGVDLAPRMWWRLTFLVFRPSTATGCSPGVVTS